MDTTLPSLSRLRRWSLLGALFALACGTFTLAAWGLRHPAWAAVIPGWIPMAPSTAMLLMAFGGSQLLALAHPRPGLRLAQAVHLLGAALAVFWSLATLAGRPQHWEHLGFALSPAASGPGHAGHISVNTALCAVIAALALLGLAPEGRSRRAWVALGGAGGLVLLTLLFALAQLFGLPIVRGTAFIPIALPTSLAFLGLGLGSFIWALTQVPFRGTLSPLDLRLGGRLMLILLLVVALMLSGSFLGYRLFERHHLGEVARQLAAIAALKADGLTRYRRERTIDAELLQNNPSLGRLFQRAFLPPGDPRARAELWGWMARYLQLGEYDHLWVVDTGGRVQMSSAEGHPFESVVLRQALGTCLARQKVLFQDLYRCELNQQVYMALLVPVCGGRGEPLGAVVLRMDPRTHLYPYLSRWPTPSRSGTTELVRREGEAAVYLHDVPASSGGALDLRFPLGGHPGLPAVQAVQGRSGFLQTLDDRGVPVVAHVDRVPGSPWFLVVRLGEEEAHAALKERLWQILVLDLLLGAILAAGLALLWRQQRERVLHERLEREQEHRFLEVQLARSQKMESLGSLAGGVAHDMNNVLGAILGLASAHLQIQPPGSPAHKAFETIERAARRGGRLVRSLLDFARQGLVEEKPVDLNALIREEGQLLEHTTFARVEPRLDLAPGLRSIWGDSASLAHLLMNLCVNAVDALAEGGSLTLRTRNLEGDQVEVRVEDTGAGMPREVLERAMEPFFTTKPEGKGSGLGLSIAYGIVKAHRGQIELLSTPGEGTTVVLRFPASPRGVPSDPEPSSAWAPVPPRRVLLVDDDELVRSSTRTMLDLLGHETEAVASGEEALERLRAGAAAEVVILDLNMPGLGGAGTLPQLKALRPGLPVLLATGRADQNALDLVAAHPGVALVAKPFSLEELRQAIDTTVGAG